MEDFDSQVRRIVRSELASLAGKALRRTQDRELSRSGERNMMVDIANREAAQFWGEVLAEYGPALPEVAAGDAAAAAQLAASDSER